jgi:hypothetical protein
VLNWQHRITRIRERCTDLFGRDSWRWRVIRTSNAYQFIDPQAEIAAFLLSAKSAGNATSRRF